MNNRAYRPGQGNGPWTLCPININKHRRIAQDESHYEGRAVGYNQFYTAAACAA